MVTQAVPEIELSESPGGGSHWKEQSSFSLPLSVTLTPPLSPLAVRGKLCEPLLGLLAATLLASLLLLPLLLLMLLLLLLTPLLSLGMSSPKEMSSGP